MGGRARFAGGASAVLAAALPNVFDDASAAHPAFALQVASEASADRFAGALVPAGAAAVMAGASAADRAKVFTADFAVPRFPITFWPGQIFKAIALRAS
jgi:hypothetical protein